MMWRGAPYNSPRNEKNLIALDASIANQLTCGTRGKGAKHGDCRGNKQE